jgi:hypothetical protein
MSNPLLPEIARGREVPSEEALIVTSKPGRVA